MFKVAKAHQDVLQQQVSKVSAYLNQTQGSPRTGKVELSFYSLLTHSHTMTPFDAPGKQAF